MSNIDDIRRSLATAYHEPGDTPEIAMQQALEDIRYLLSRWENAREALEEVDTAIREGLEAWPKIMSRTEFIRWCVEERVRQATRSLTADLEHWKAAADNLARKLSETEAKAAKDRKRLTDIVTDDEIAIVEDIYRRQTEMGDPYALNRAVEDLLLERRKQL